MVSRLSNYEVLDGWLAYLQEIAGSVTGANKTKILDSVTKQVQLQKERGYFLEAPLQGEAGIDFALQYSSNDFLRKQESVSGVGSLYNRFFQLYAGMVGEGRKITLEFDTANGSGANAAIFLDINGAGAEQVITKTLAFQAETRRLKKILTILNQGQEKGLLPASLGVVFSRFNMPIRLSFGIPQEILRLPDRYDNFARFVQELEFEKKSMAMQRMLERGQEQVRQLMSNYLMLKDLLLLSELDFVDCVLDVDVMADGSIGDTIGISIVPYANNVAQQHKMLNSKEYSSFVKLLKSWDVTDDRIKQLTGSIFYADLPQALGEQEHLFSLLSHFKLRYKHNKRITAKLFLKGYRGY